MTRLHSSTILALTILHMSVAQEVQMPTLELLPSSILKPVGEGVYVSCQAKVPDTGLVTEMHWYGPSGDRIPNEDLSVNIMEPGNPGQLDLTIEKLRDQDTGVYNCTATYASNQKLTASVNVQSFMDIDFGDTPIHQTPHINTQAKIQCTPEARPAPLVDWLKDMVPLRNDDNHIIQQDGILLKSVTEADEGMYRCRARVPQLGSIKYRDIQVEVYIPPIIDQPPEDSKGVEKESVTFNCGATGKPAPEYSWVDKDNRPLDNLDDYFVDSEKGILSIMSLKPEHTGTYRCTATNPAGDDNKSAHLQVLTKPKIEQFLNITNDVNEEGEMRCIVTGDPAPEIVFKKETNENSFADGINQDDRISVKHEVDEEQRKVGILKFRSVSRSDDGLYTCTASSEGGVTQVWGHITVEFKPTFENQPYSEKWSWEQAPVNLTCLATSIPNATIQWFFRRQLIDPSDPNLRVLSLGPLGVLNVNPLSSSYFGAYSCNATNKLGGSEWNIDLKEAHVPGPVQHSKVEKKTATTITWSLVDPTDDGGLPIQGYVVEYRTQDMHWDNGEHKFWSKGSSYTLDKLIPMETYVFRFAARNDAGEGEWGGEKSEEMPRHAEPEEPLIFGAQTGVAEIPYPDHYTLQWKVPLDNGKEIDYFQINYYQVHNNSGNWELHGSAETETVEYPGDSSYTVQSLYSNAFYKIELRAHNEIGFSTPAEVIIKTAHGPDVSEQTEQGLELGIIVAIIVIALIVLIVFIDVTCYVTKKAGVTAMIVGKRGQKDKDKEAMLEDGKNTSEDKHEGNGQMKTQEKEEDVKKSEPEPENKNKESSEPTETTPMIQGPLHLDHNWEDGNTWRHQDEIQINKQENIPLQNVTMHNQNRQNARHSIDLLSSEVYVSQENIPANRGTQPVILKMIEKKTTDPSGNRMKSSASTPALDLSTSDDSIYAKPYQEEGPIGNPQYPLGVNKRPPPLPSRNPNTHLSNTMSKSQEFLSSDNQHQTILPLLHLETQGNYPTLNRGPTPRARFASTDALYDTRNSPSTLPRSRDRLNFEPSSYNMITSREGLGFERPRSPYMMSASRELLNQDSATPDYMSRSREILNQAPVSPYMRASREALDQNFRYPHYIYGSREALIKGPRLPSAMSRSREHLDQRLYNPPTESREFLSPDLRNIQIPRKTSSISSASTLYQPVNAAQERVPTRTAVGVAPYDQVMAASQVNRYPTNHNLMPQTRIPTPPSTRQPVFPMELVNTRLPVSRLQPAPKLPMTSMSRPTAPPPPVPPEPQATPLRDSNKPLRMVTKVYFRESPPIHSIYSHSMDYLDSVFDTPRIRDTTTVPVPSITPAKSLGSLLDSGQHLRSYGQPTII